VKDNVLRSATCYVSTGDPLLVMSVLEIRCLLCQYWRSAACYASFISNW